MLCSKQYATYHYKDRDSYNFKDSKIKEFSLFLASKGLKNVTFLICVIFQVIRCKERLKLRNFRI
jgi:hypothetical protein